MMRGDIARTQLLYESIIKQLKEANLAREFGGFDARVIAEPGSGGVKKVEPSNTVLAAVTALLAVLCGTGLAGLVELISRGRSPRTTPRAMMPLRSALSKTLG